MYFARTTRIAIPHFFVYLFLCTHGVRSTSQLQEKSLQKGSNDNWIFPKRRLDLFCIGLIWQARWNYWNFWLKASTEIKGSYHDLFYHARSNRKEKKCNIVSFYFSRSFHTAHYSTQAPPNIRASGGKKKKSKKQDKSHPWTSDNFVNLATHL